jgi:DNA-binding HxlR family transcriptional regulator
MGKNNDCNHDISKAECQQSLNAMKDALYVIGGKWKLPILISLRGGHRRFGELQRSVEGIAAKVLSNELKDMELNGFVKRTVYDTTPVTVEYEATPYSETLHDVIKTLAEWGAMHQKKIRGRLKERKIN